MFWFTTATAVIVFSFFFGLTEHLTVTFTFQISKNPVIKAVESLIHYKWSCTASVLAEHGLVTGSSFSPYGLYLHFAVITSVSQI